MLFDKDKSGYIEAREIREVTTTMGMPLSLEELEDFMKMADQNGDGRLDYNEFVKAMTKFWFDFLFLLQARVAHKTKNWLDLTTRDRMQITSVDSEVFLFFVV